MQRYFSRFILLSLAAMAPASAQAGDPAPAPAAASDLGALEVQVGDQKYRLPAAGEAPNEKDPAPPIAAETLATLEAWRAFAWDSGKKKYLYGFAVSAGTSAVTVLTSDSSAGQYAETLDSAARLLTESVGGGQLGKSYVAIVCATAEEYQRAVDFAGQRAIERTQDPALQTYLVDSWIPASKKNPTFYQEVAGVVGCVEGNSEKWSPEHEILRGFAVVVALERAPRLWHALPLLIGLSWNVEYDVSGDILSMPYGDEFQFDIGRGTWSASKINSILKKLAKEVKQERKRDLALGDLPWLGRGEGSTGEGAAIAWATARHLMRHHGARLPAFLTAVSEEIVAQNSVVHGDGSTSFQLAPDYQLGWESMERVLAAAMEGYDFEDLQACIGAACPDCKAWAKAHGVR